MRSLSILLGLAAAIVPTLAFRLSTSPAHSLLKRAFTDVCGTASEQLVCQDQGTGEQTAFGPVVGCLCYNGIAAFEANNAAGQAAVEQCGEPAATAALKGIINRATNSRTCNYPDHGVERCANNNPCAFQCTDGYDVGPSLDPECICTAPKTVCNGQCGSFPNGCSSVTPRRNAEYHARAVQRTCQSGQTACEVVGGDAKDWECVDTNSDLESCGGCSRYSRVTRQPLGADCTSLPNIADVACVKGTCSIQRCAAGFAVATNGTVCLPNNADEATETAALVQAVEYGFEHLLHWT